MRMPPRCGMAAAAATLACLDLACMGFGGPASAEGLVSMLSTNAVEITSNYAGTEIAIFGAIERDAATVSRGSPYQMVITVKGPSAPLVVREKEKAGVIWVNSEQRKFGDVPGFFAVLSSGALAEIVDDDAQKRMQIGDHGITSSLEPTVGDRTGPGAGKATAASFEHALIRLRREQGLYMQYPAAVTFQRANTFRAQVPLPASAPLGRYEVTTYLFSGGVPLAQEKAVFFVRKIGFEAATAAAARNRPFSYGLVAAAMALIVGWLASVIFRRD